MIRTRLAALLIPLFLSGAAFAVTPGGPDTSQKAAELGRTFAVLHAVGQEAITVSQLADQKAKSDLVKSYAHAMVTANTSSDAKLQALAQKDGIGIASLDPQTEEGKSLIDRIKGEEALLGSLEGDAFDKEYMTLVTNTQQSVIHLLDARIPLARDPDIKQFLGDMKSSVQTRLKTAQSIMAKLYGDTV